MISNHPTIKELQTEQERKRLQTNLSGKNIEGAKVDARVVQQKKSTGFSCMSVIWVNLLHFGCFAAG